MRRSLIFVIVGMLLVLLGAGCGGGNENADDEPTSPPDPTPTAVEPDTAPPTTPEPTSPTPLATTEPTATQEPTTTLPGVCATVALDTPCEPFDGFAMQGDVLKVMGRAYNDLLSVGAAEVRPVTPSGGMSADLVATGRARLLAGSIWYEVTVFEEATGWVSASFAGFVGATDDATANFLAQSGTSEFETMVDLGLLVADFYASDDPPSLIVQSFPPVVWDLGEIAYDVVGLGDDAVAGIRLRVFAIPSESGEGFALKSIERTTFCSRGVSGEQCI